jgi:DHA1 family multidrug resistance protein-like MFS transporter
MNRRAVFYPFLAVYAYQQLGANLVQVGLLSALPMVASSITQPYWGRLSDRIGKRKLFIIIGETIAGIAYLLMMGLTEIWHLIIGLTVLEGFWSMSNVAWSTLIIDSAAPSERGRVMGYLNTIGVAGTAFGVFVAGIMYDTTGFMMNFAISAAMMFVSVAVVWAWVIDHKTSVKSSLKITSESKEEAGDLTMLKMLVVTLSLSMFGINGLRQLMMIYMGSGLGFSGTLIGTVSAAGNVTNLLLGIPVGYLSDRVDKRKLYMVVLALNAATPAVLIFSETPFHFILVSTLVGMSWPLSETTAFPLAGEFAPATNRGKFLGYFNAVRFLCGFGLPPLLLGGYLTELLKNMHLMRGLQNAEALILSSKETFVVAMAITMIGVILWVPALKKRKN